MIKRICDICGNDIKSIENYYILRLYNMTPTLQQPTVDYNSITSNSCVLRSPKTTEEKEICVDCYSNLMAHIKSRKE